VIGPEGGFTDVEIAAAVEAGAHVVNLGLHILRLETAAIAALAWLRLGIAG
jgi:16S rRNA (uracil1498-N3)-methyltransferase